MPGKLWRRTDDGVLASDVLDRGSSAWRPESLVLADRLDEGLDVALDEAARLFGSVSHPDVPERFTAAWAIGKALSNSNIQNHRALEFEDPKFIWRVLFNKAVIRVRSDGTTEEDWDNLRPDIRFGKTTNRQGGQKGDDYWSMCVWLAEQDHSEAAHIFGGSIRNVWQMIERPTLRVLVMKKALSSWLADLPEDVADQITSTKIFPELMKKLRSRWPARGKRRALQPVHYSQEELKAEIDRLVDLKELLGDMVTAS